MTSFASPFLYYFACMKILTVGYKHASCIIPGGMLLYSGPSRAGSLWRAPSISSWGPEGTPARDSTGFVLATRYLKFLVVAT